MNKDGWYLLITSICGLLSGAFGAWVGQHFHVINEREKDKKVLNKRRIKILTEVYRSIRKYAREFPEIGPKDIAIKLKYESNNSRYNIVDLKKIIDKKIKICLEDVECKNSDLEYLKSIKLELNEMEQRISNTFNLYKKFYEKHLDDYEDYASREVRFALYKFIEIQNLAFNEGSLALLSKSEDGPTETNVLVEARTELIEAMKADLEPII